MPNKLIWLIALVCGMLTEPSRWCRQVDTNGSSGRIIIITRGTCHSTITGNTIKQGILLPSYLEDSLRKENHIITGTSSRLVDTGSRPVEATHTGAAWCSGMHLGSYPVIPACCLALGWPGFTTARENHYQRLISPTVSHPHTIRLPLRGTSYSPQNEKGDKVPQVIDWDCRQEPYGSRILVTYFCL